MSEEHLPEPRIPRRRFLKGTATAAFVAPVIVSFGLDGIAEADSNSPPSQCFANMSFGNQAFSDIESALELLQELDIDHGIATSLRQKLLNAEASLSRCNAASACGQLGAFQNELTALSGKKIDQGAAQILAWDITQAQSSLGCFGGS